MTLPWPGPWHWKPPYLALSASSRSRSGGPITIPPAPVATEPLRDDSAEKRSLCCEDRSCLVVIMAGSITDNRFDIINGKQLALLIAPLFCFVVASAAVAARWYTRSVRRINTLTEDVLMLAALVRLNSWLLLNQADIPKAMSFAVVTIVYVLVFLGGEGLTSDQIKADPTKNFHVVNRFWLRVRLKPVIAPNSPLTCIQVTIRTRHLLGHIHCHCSNRFRQSLSPPV